MNVISNAIDAIGDNEGVISIASRQQNELTTLSITDSGSGMDEQTVSRIFEPFYTTKDVGKGTGIGMHIVQKEIEKHKGSIKINSEIGKGTTFEIELPNVAPELEKAA